MIVRCRGATNTSNAIADNVQRQHLQCYRGQHPYLEPKCYCTYAKTLKFQVEATTSICGPKNGGLWRRAVYCTVLHVRTMSHHAAFRLVFLDSKWLSACMYIYMSSCMRTWGAGTALPLLGVRVGGTVRTCIQDALENE